MSLFGRNRYSNVTTDPVSGETGEALEVPHLEGKDKGGYDGKIEAGVTEVSKFVSV